MRRDIPIGKGVIFFAQLGSFSHTNNSISSNIKEFLPDMKIESVQVFPIIRKNLLLLAWCALGVITHYGFISIFDFKEFKKKIIKTPFFFNLASKILKSRAGKISNLKAVLQTQGLFNASIEGVPLIIYTDNTILNPINDKLKSFKINNDLVNLERLLYRSADKIAVSARHVKQSLLTDYSISPDHVDVVLIGPNTPKFNNPAIERPARQQILFVGIDWERKGGPDLIEAFHRLVRSFPEARLVIAGCTPDVDHPNISVLGRVPPERITELMAESSIFCMPSLVEPSSVAVLEASRAGLPVVGTSCGGFLDSVVHGKTGLLVPPGDSQALAGALTHLLENPRRCKEMGCEAMEWMEHFDWPVVCKKLAASIVSLTGSNQRIHRC